MGLAAAWSRAANRLGAGYAVRVAVGRNRFAARSSASGRFCVLAARSSQAIRQSGDCNFRAAERAASLSLEGEGSVFDRYLFLEQSGVVLLVLSSPELVPAGSNVPVQCRTSCAGHVMTYWFAEGLGKTRVDAAKVLARRKTRTTGVTR